LSSSPFRCGAAVFDFDDCVLASIGSADARVALVNGTISASSTPFL